MSIFNFKDKQRLHTQIYGQTSGDEMFKIDEYNTTKGYSFALGFIIFCLFTVFYFFWDKIQSKILFFLIIITVVLGILMYFNIKNQLRLKERLYG